MAVTNVELFNSVRNGLSSSFQSRIPEATATNIKEIGMMITSNEFKAEFNDWLTEAVNRIAMVLIRDNIIKNKLGRFIRFNVTFGDIIEDIWVEPIKGENYNPGNDDSHPDPFRQNNPTVKVEYHRQNDQRVYLATVFPARARKAFENEGQLQRLIDQIVKQIYNADALDTFVITKEIFNEAINSPVLPLQANQMIEVDAIVDTQTGKDFVNSIKNVVTAMTFPTSDYNIQGVTKMVEPEDLTIFIRADLLNFIDVNVLSSAFNRSDLNFTPNDSNGFMKMIAMDNFGGLVAQDSAGNNLFPKYNQYGKQIGYTATNETTDNTLVEPAKFVDPNEDVLAIIAEDDWLIIAKNLESTDVIWNPAGLYYNTWAHFWNTFGYSGFMNMVVIKRKTA